MIYHCIADIGRLETILQANIISCKIIPHFCWQNPFGFANKRFITVSVEGSFSLVIFLNLPFEEKKKFNLVNPKPLITVLHTKRKLMNRKRKATKHFTWLTHAPVLVFELKQNTSNRHGKVSGIW